MDTVFQEGRKETQQTQHKVQNRAKTAFSNVLGMHLSKWPSSDTQNELHTQTEWVAKEVTNQKQSTPGNKADITGNGWEAEREKQPVMCISVSKHASSLSVMSPGARPHAPEVRTRKWTWARGGWTADCYSVWGPQLGAIHVWDEHPTPRVLKLPRLNLLLKKESPLRW